MLSTSVGTKATTTQNSVHQNVEIIQSMCER